MRVIKISFYKYAPFISCISKNNNTLVDNVEDLGIVMSMCNLPGYRKSYSKTTWSLWNYYRDGTSSGAEVNINYSIKDSNLLIIKRGSQED